jgi:single-stranded-DNA-specific exonuclease
MRHALTMVQNHSISDLLARILAGRDIPINDVPAFLSPRLRNHFPDPMHLRDMDKAVIRLGHAIKNSESIFIVGDYDVDGACSSALLSLFLKHCNTPCFVHIPDRLQEGYGPSLKAVAAAKDSGARIFITVDCGTLSHDIIAQARLHNLDVLVLDHHQASDHLPDALVINPNRQDECSPLGHLCATGVVFCFLVALRRYLISEGFWSESNAPHLLETLDLVALATVADVVPLTGLNRAFVAQGLAVLKKRLRIGLAALMEIGGIKNAPEAWHLGFVLGPRVNAGGRIGDSSLGFRLLTTHNPHHAQELARRLDQHNRERQALEAHAVEQACAQAEKQYAATPYRSALIVHDPSWHPGILGLIAARVKENFRCPCFALTSSRLESPGWVGSGRSVPGIDLGALVRKAVEKGLLIKGGGHAMAAGITVQASYEALDTFRLFIHATLLEGAPSTLVEETLEIDGALSARSVTPERLEDLMRAGPYGTGHPEPLFAFPHHKIVSLSVIKEAHIRLRLQDDQGHSINAMAFRAHGTALGDHLCSSMHNSVHVVGSLSLDSFRGVKTPLIRIIDSAQ